MPFLLLHLLLLLPWLIDCLILSSVTQKGQRLPLQMSLLNIDASTPSPLYLPPTHYKFNINLATFKRFSLPAGVWLCVWVCLFAGMCVKESHQIVMPLYKVKASIRCGGETRTTTAKWRVKGATGELKHTQLPVCVCVTLCMTSVTQFRMHSGCKSMGLPWKFVCNWKKYKYIQ